MAAKPLPSPEVLRQLLRYEPETGKLFWLPRPREMFATSLAFTSWNTRYSEKEALTALNDKGYPSGAILAKSVAAHRVIWAIVHGAWPSTGIDHINGDRADNRIGNLRLANKSENAMNAGVRKSSASGFKGVRKVKNYEKWCARIMVGQKRQYLGYFDTPGEAHAAYCAAAERLHGEFARTE